MNMVDRKFWALGMVMMSKISMVLDKKKLDHEDAQQVIQVLVDQTDDFHLEDKRPPGDQLMPQRLAMSVVESQ